MPMLNVSISSKPMQMSASNIKTVHSLDESGKKTLEKIGIFPFVVPQDMKMVEISCLNKVYRGFAFSNQNGGLEFYNEDYRRNISASDWNILNEYKREESRLSNEIAAIEKEIRDGDGKMEDETKRLIGMETRLDQAQEEFEQLKEKVRKGQLGMDEINRQRSILMTEINQLSKGIPELEGEIEVFLHKKRLLPFLNLRLRALRIELAERSRNLSVPQTVSIDKQGVSFFPKFEGITTLHVCLFASFIDYLAYKTLCADERLSQRLGLIKCDCIVMNNPSNFIQMMIDSDGYDVVHCFFPNTISGEVMERSIMSRNPHGVSETHIYAEVGCLYNYVQKKLL